MGIPAVDPVAYFWSKVKRAEGRHVDRCWLWIGPISSYGYGDMNIARSSTRLAHRFAYELLVGPIPAGAVVCHHCDVPACVNPSHLFVGTHADNMHDKKQKGRAASRSRNGGAKLTDQQYDEIEKRVAAGEKQNALAREFGVSPQAVCQYLKRRAVTA